MGHGTTVRTTSSPSSALWSEPGRQTEGRDEQWLRGSCSRDAGCCVGLGSVWRLFSRRQRWRRSRRSRLLARRRLDRLARFHDPLPKRVDIVDRHWYILHSAFATSYFVDDVAYLGQDLLRFGLFHIAPSDGLTSAVLTIGFACSFEPACLSSVGMKTRHPERDGAGVMRGGAGTGTSGSTAVVTSKWITASN